MYLLEPTPIAVVRNYHAALVRNAPTIKIRSRLEGTLLTATVDDIAHSCAADYWIQYLHNYNAMACLISPLGPKKTNNRSVQQTTKARYSSQQLDVNSHTHLA